MLIKLSYNFFTTILFLAFGAFSAQASESLMTNVHKNFDQQVIESSPEIRAILENDDSASNLSKSGAFFSNSDENIKTRGLRIESQRQAWSIVANAVAKNGFSLAKDGLRAIEWGFSDAIAGANGSWPSQDNETVPTSETTHNKSMFLYAAGRSLHLLKSASFTKPNPEEINDFQKRVDAAILLAARSARWMASSANTEEFFNNAIIKGKQTNQLLFVSMALIEIGILAHDKALIAEGQRRISQTSALITADGIFPEGSGHPEGYIFDSSYQTVSLEIFARYISFMQDSSEKYEFLKLLNRGTDRFLSVVQSDGTIDTSKNSRTEACGFPISGDALSKGQNVDRIPFRLRYLGLLLNRSVELNSIANLVLAAGLGYDHFGCGR